MESDDVVNNFNVVFLDPKFAEQYFQKLNLNLVRL